MKRKMPTKQQIKSHWQDRLVGLGKFLCKEDFHEHDACFACGISYGDPTERAHILARCDGGTDAVENLHLLCHACHKQSEFMSGDQYWSWLKEQKPVHSALYWAVRNGIQVQELWKNINDMGTQR